KNGFWDFVFCLAAEDGEIVKSEQIYEDGYVRETSGYEIFNAMKVRQQVAALLDIEPGSVGLSDGYEEYVEDGYRRSVRWKFLYLTIAEFERFRKSKKISVIAENSVEYPSQRWIAPHPLRIRNATYAFDIKTAKVKFVRKHYNCIEYVSPEGIRVFDNRRRHSGTRRNYKTGEMEPVPTREACLRELLYAIGSGSKAKPLANEEAERLRNYAANLLVTLGVYSDDVTYSTGWHIAKGIELLYGDAYVPAMDMFYNQAVHDRDQQSWQKRIVLRDSECRDMNPSNWDEQKRTMQTCHVVLMDNDSP
ncbi:MAG: hypothetical protein G01um101456_657, partial [Parcubacteria group bacterium Gr01-1014_56]